MTFSPIDYQRILRRDLTSFIDRSFRELNPQTEFLPASYIELIAAKLEACRQGKIRRLIINIPPRTLKSHCASVVFPAWLLGHDAASNIICVSYGQELAEKFARDCRRLMQSSWYRALFPTRLADRLAVHDFATTQHGTRFATSVGGVLTGRGADMIIIDDPLKPDDAMSQTRRQAVNEWYDNTLLSRLNNKAKGCIIIIMQRLHQDDLVGHVLEQEAWEVLSLPAIAEDDHRHVIDGPFGKRDFYRPAGTALHPEREPIAVLEALRRAVGEYNFVSQYQQTPVPPGGNIVKTEWLRYYDRGDLPERFTKTLQSWDTANKASELNDFSVCTTWGMHDQKFYLLDVYRRRLEFPDLRRAVIEQAKRHGVQTILVEDKASGTQLIQDLRGEIFGLTPYSPPPGSDKIMRLHTQSPVFENGHVLLPRQASWLDEYVRELTAFPGSKFDDQVDSTTQALDHMRNALAGLLIWEKLGRR